MIHLRGRKHASRKRPGPHVGSEAFVFANEIRDGRNIAPTGFFASGPAVELRQSERASGHPEGFTHSSSQGAGARAQVGGCNRVTTGGTTGHPRKGAHPIGPGGRKQLRPMPDLPTDGGLILGRVMELGTPGTSRWWRVRSKAAIAVALSVSPSVAFAEAVRWQPSDVREFVRCPRKAWRWILAWLQLREHALGPTDAARTSWLSMAPRTSGDYRRIRHAMTRTLELAGCPSWRSGQLMGAGWGTGVDVATHHEVMRG